MLPNSTILVATLGGQPQIVTFTLDLLLARGEDIDHVILVHFGAGERNQAAYRRLIGEFAGDRYRSRSCHLRNIPVRLHGKTLADARTRSEVDAVWQVFYQLFYDLKTKQQSIHLSLTGGRRVLGLLAFSGAMLHFTSADRVWHLHTSESLTNQSREGAIMHALDNEGIELIEVPLVPWGAYFPGVKALLGHSPAEIRTAQLGWLNETERSNCHRVWSKLTHRQKDVLELFGKGLSRPQVAVELNLSIATVDSHKTEILRICRMVWETDVKLDVYFLRQKFGPFLAGMKEV